LKQIDFPFATGIVYVSKVGVFAANSQKGQLRFFDGKDLEEITAMNTFHPFFTGPHLTTTMI